MSEMDSAFLKALLIGSFNFDTSQNKHRLHCVMCLIMTDLIAMQFGLHCMCQS